MNDFKLIDYYLKLKWWQFRKVIKASKQLKKRYGL
jgi:hypothetical protein